jgi:uncharacterized protein DUF4159
MAISPRSTAAALLVASLAATPLLHAQNIIRGGRRGMPPRFAQAIDFDGSFMYCRAMYRSILNTGSGSGWDTDYPAADNNFSVRLAELTLIRVKFNPDSQPAHVVLRLTDPLIARCPLLFMEDVGTAKFSDAEIVALRDYLLKGGFLWVDDFWGSYAWERWVEEIGRVLPAGQYPITDVPVDHAIMHTLYDVRKMPQVPSISHWYRSGGGTSERGPDSAAVTFKGIRDEKGRLMIVMTHNTDIADTWEREGENREYFEKFSPEGYAIGVNFILYAMTH